MKKWCNAELDATERNGQRWEGETQIRGHTSGFVCQYYLNWTRQEAAEDCERHRLAHRVFSVIHQPFPKTDNTTDSVPCWSYDMPLKVRQNHQGDKMAVPAAARWVVSGRWALAGNAPPPVVFQCESKQADTQCIRITSTGTHEKTHSVWQSLQQADTQCIRITSTGTHEKITKMIWCERILNKTTSSPWLHNSVLRQQAECNQHWPLCDLNTI